MKIPLNNVSLRAFLYLSNLENLKRELSNTTICDYILETFAEFSSRYKDRKSFRSGYAGNLALIFDSDESLGGDLNKFSKVLEPLLKRTMQNLRTVKIAFEGDFCLISRIPSQEDWELLAVFFNLKPINAAINKRAGLREPEKGWLGDLCGRFGLAAEEMPPHRALETGRGQAGAKAILNRYTIYNRGNVWFDVLKPNYYNFRNLRYKLYLRSLLIEQDNLFYCILRHKEWDFGYRSLFERVIAWEGETPALNHEALGAHLALEEILLIDKEKLKPRILENVAPPRNYQYMFTLVDHFLVFQDGTMIDVSDILVREAREFREKANWNPNVSFDTRREGELKKSLASRVKRDVDFKLRRISQAGEESHTVMKFIEKSGKGLLKIRDYRRSPGGFIEYGPEKTCLIVFNGTKYPDFLCIFLEDAERVEKRGSRSYSAYSRFVLEESPRFRHLFFEVEAEYNQSSFRSHDTSAASLLKCKYIFCENKTSDLYESRFKVAIPVIGIREIA